MKSLGRLWPTRLAISGTDIRQRQARERRIWSVLCRDVRIEALEALSYAYKPEAIEIELREAAIVLDSSAFLRLGPQPNVIDYLRSKHHGPVVLPGQSVQEFWNNNLNVAESIASGIRKKFLELKKEMSKVDDTFEDFEVRFKSLLDEFEGSFGYAYDGNTVRRTMSLFDALKSKAIVSYVKRDTFCKLADHRKNTKTPPGFRDDQDGDFFVWADLLDGLLVARSRGSEFRHVVLITNDKKLDWSREGVAHPILSAEMKALLGATLTIWDVPKLVSTVEALAE